MYYCCHEEHWFQTSVVFGASQWLGGIRCTLSSHNIVGSNLALAVCGKLSALSCLYSLHCILSGKARMHLKHNLTK